MTLLYHSLLSTGGEGAEGLATENSFFKKLFYLTSETSNC